MFVEFIFLRADLIAERTDGAILWYNVLKGGGVLFPLPRAATDGCTPARSVQPDVSCSPAPDAASSEAGGQIMRKFFILPQKSASPF